MTITDPVAQYSIYGALLLNYLREEKLVLETSTVDGKDWIDFQRTIGEARVVTDVPEELGSYFTPEYQAQVKKWAADQGVPTASLPELGSVPSGSNDPSEEPADG